MPVSTISPVKVGYRYLSSAGNLWDIIAFLPNDRVKVELVATGTQHIWHISSTSDLTEQYSAS